MTSSYQQPQLYAPASRFWSHSNRLFVRVFAFPVKLFFNIRCAGVIQTVTVCVHPVLQHTNPDEIMGPLNVTTQLQLYSNLHFSGFRQKYVWEPPISQLAADTLCGPTVTTAPDTHTHTHTHTLAHAHTCANSVALMWAGVLCLL